MPRGLDAETLDMALTAIREFSEAELSDKALLEMDHEDRFPEDIVRRMLGEDVGIALLFVDEECGGMGGGAFDVTRVCEVLGGVDLGVATGVLATFLGSDPIVVGGTPEQKKRYMSRLAEEGLLMAYAATEPDAGSDLAALKTVAKAETEAGELKGYRITGAKQWISNGAFADLYTVLAAAPGGPTWFVVEKGAEGLAPGKPEDKHGIRASNTSAVNLDDVFVTPDALLGGVEGQGLAQAQAVFGYTRLMVAAFGLGAGWAALNRAIEYSRDRIQAGGPLSEKPGYTHKLIVPFAARLEASRAFIEETALRIDEGSEGSLNTEGAIAKYIATEAGNDAAEAAIQALGGYGYTHEYMVEKIKRDVRITTIYEGTSEIMEMTIARDRWQAHLKTRGAHYIEEAARMAQLAEANPACGANLAADAMAALAQIFEIARRDRLTRHQHVLFRLGSLAARVEVAAAAARRAERRAKDSLDPRAERRFDVETLGAMARIAAREAAAALIAEGVPLVTSAPESSSDEVLATIGLERLVAGQKGLLSDMDRVADALYGRV